MKEKISIIILLLLFCSTGYASISGPQTCVNGELAVLQATENSNWIVYPSEYQTSYTVVNDGKTCVFASPKKGCVTFIAASVEGENNIVLNQHVLYNGVDKPENESVVEPEKEDITSIEGVVKAETKKVECETKSDELKAMTDSFDETVGGINRGTVKTPEGARATFRALWVSKGSSVSAESIKRWEELLTAVSSKVDNTSLDAIKKDYERISTAIKNCTPAKAAQGSPAPTPGSPSKTQNCPTGNCPNQQYKGRRYFTW